MAGVAGAVEELAGEAMVEPGVAVKTDAPLGLEAQEQADDGPVFGPDFDGV